MSNVVRFVVVVAVLTGGIVHGAGKKRRSAPARRPPTSPGARGTRADGNALPLSSSADIRDAIVMLEQARVTLCEVESTMLATYDVVLPANAFAGQARTPVHDRPASSLRRGAALYKRVPAMRPMNAAAMLQIAATHNFLAGSAIHIDSTIRRCGPLVIGVDTRCVGSMRHLAIGASRNLTDFMSTTVKQAVLDRDATFEDLPVLRFWNETDVAPEDIAAAAVQLRRQADHDEALIWALLERNDRLGRLFDVYHEYSELVSTRVIQPAIGAVAQQGLQLSLDAQLEELAEWTRVSNIAASLDSRLTQDVTKLLMSSDVLDNALVHLRECRDHVDRLACTIELLFFPSASAENRPGAPGDGPVKKAKKKKKPTKQDSRVRGDKATGDVVVDDVQPASCPGADAVKHDDSIASVELPSRGPIQTAGTKRKPGAKMGTDAYGGTKDGHDPLSVVEPVHDDVYANASNIPGVSEWSAGPLDHDGAALSLLLNNSSGALDANTGGGTPSASPIAVGDVDLQVPTRAIPCSAVPSNAFTSLTPAADIRSAHDVIAPNHHQAADRDGVRAPRLQRRETSSSGRIPAGAASLIAAHNAKLTSGLHAFMRSAEADRHRDYDAHRCAFHAVQHAVRRLFRGDRRAHVKVAGSVAYGLHLAAPVSDLDLVVQHPAMSAGDGLQRLSGAIATDPAFSSVKYIARASTPIIKATASNSSVTVDISWNVANVDDSRHLVREAVDAFPLFRPITMYMKYYLYMHGLGTPYDGGLGSFQLYLLVIFHLQANAASCTMSAGACLRALFEFYGSSFPVEQQCVSVRTKGRPVLKRTVGRTDDAGLCIVSPFDATADVGRSAFNFGAIRRQMHSTYLTMTRSCEVALSELTCDAR